MNSIQLIGRLTADIDLKVTQSGLSVCKFNLAVDRPRVKDTTDFITCVAWRNTAEFMSRYFKKGNKVALTGILTTHKWQDDDGKTRVAYEVIVENVEFCESKPQTSMEEKGAEEKTAGSTPQEIMTNYYAGLSNSDSDDLPF